VTVKVEGKGAGIVPTDERNLVARAALAAFEAMGMPAPGLRLRCANRIPHGRGLGSSAAAIVAGVLLAQALASRVQLPSDRLLDDADVLDLSASLEGHPDNVAAALLGGLTIAWEAGTGGDQGRVARAVRLDPVPEVVPVVLVPTAQASTEQARRLLPPEVPHPDAVANAARAALLVVALTQRPDLLLVATEDRLHQSYRAPAMPESAAMVERLRAKGMPAVISGAGPSVLVLMNAATATEVAAGAPAGWIGLMPGVDPLGARLVS
jgi:homoserine kinase